MTFDVTGGTPGSKIAFVFALGTGNVKIPGGKPCAGTTLGLNGSAKLAALQTADANGDASLNATVKSGLCGKVYLQAVDFGSCNTSNVILVQ